MRGMKGFLLAGTHSGCGKTTVTLGLLAALTKRGLKVQSFKAGPDFIDAGLHGLITGRAATNLDIWMCGEDYVKGVFDRRSQAAHISVVEGVMGMYDGDYNSAKLAELLGLPVVLIVDAYGMAESAGAIVTGFKGYGSIMNKLAGVIFNRVASERHYERLKNSVEDVQVFGYLPRDLNFEIPHRHLGLTVAEENPIAKENIESLANAVLRHIDIDTILVMDDYCLSLHSRKASKPSSEAETARFSVRDTLGLSKSLQAIIHDSQSFSDRLKKGGDCPRFTGVAVESGLSPTSAPKIAIAYDRAFCFYYEDNLDLLKDAGAEIVRFSPLSDSKIPDRVDAVYIGGGYPELYAKMLSENNEMLKSIKEWSDSGMPLYAECGGLMYLSKGIHDFNGNFFKMAGVFLFETHMKRGRAHLGYREMELMDECLLGKKGDRFKGHEFHYSEIVEGTVPDLRTKRSGVVESGLSPSAENIYSTKDNRGKPVDASAYRSKNTLASYIHVHFGSNLNIAQNFINFIGQEN